MANDEVQAMREAENALQTIAYEGSAALMWAVDSKLSADPGNVVRIVRALLDRLEKAEQERYAARAEAQSALARAARAEVLAPSQRIRDSITWLVGFASARASTDVYWKEVREWLWSVPDNVLSASDAANAHADNAEHKAEIASLRADLAQVTAELESVHIACCTHIAAEDEHDLDAIARAGRERDHWKAVAESRPEITPEDAGDFLRWRSAATPTVATCNAMYRVESALRAHAAKAAQVDTKVGE